MKTLDTRPEDELLVCCAKTCLDQEETLRIQSLVQKNIDWSFLIQTALKHGVISLLYQSLKKTCPDSVPADVLNQLHDYSIANTIRNMSLTDELFRILQIFELHNIPAIPYKGPVLAASVYGDIALRQFSDLDILIQERDVLKVKDLLMSQGYRPEIKLNNTQEKVFLRFQRDCKFFRDDSRSIVEIQWGITQRYFPVVSDIKHLWERLETESIDGKDVKTFSPEDYVLILCLHGFYHCWERLEWICDIAELIRVHQKMDWIRVMEQARAQGIERILLLGLLLTSDLLKVAIPEEVSQKIQADSLVKSLAAKMNRILFPEPNFSRKDFECFLLQTKIWGRLRDKVRYCLGRLMTPNAADWTLPLPAFLFFLYYFIRPIRLLRTYILRSRG
jgi:hypothetical protein